MESSGEVGNEVARPSVLAGRLGAIERALVRHPVLFVAAFVALYGYTREDFGDFELLTRNPFVTHPEVGRQFLHSSPLALFVGWPLTLGVGARASFAIVCAAGYVLLLVALQLYLRRVPAEHRRTILFVAFSTPVLLVLSRWLGKNDACLVGFFLLVLAYRDSAVLSGLFSLLLVLSHKELGTLMLVGDALVRGSLRSPIVAGAILGNGLVWSYLHSLTSPPFSRVDLALYFLDRGVTGWEINPLAHLLFAFGWFWLFLFARWQAPDRWRVAGTVLLCFAVSMDGADYTRDFILCAFPVVVYTAENVARAPEIAQWVTKGPFPLAFLVQLQVESFDLVRDTSWPSRFAALLPHLWHGKP